MVMMQPASDGGRGEDLALIARVADGDRIALEMLYRRHAGWLTTRLQARCGDPESTDIAVQDTFLSVWKSAKKFRGDGDVGAWIWGIGIRRLIDVLRKRKATPIDPAFIASAHRSAGGADQPAADDVVLSGGAYGDLATAMHRLPADLQAVLVATAIDGLSTKEAAALLGVAQGTVKTRLMRARRQLQEALT
ncbi:RNA polymerase sigma factor [Ilumatobacter coccineus]|uniref:Putative RNA polymerase ECF subfamily sigma factor n=1 Tax=Ilumatobacter coccineus (strain NBRC 103263 / KCTC 29153 / YM16-304) TaxID=1313172 RepID=A0A6C7EKU1_ILUCY|nr:putative RNA polymerase ECF subfamily sigma factor [Ilumatobacter coccineus YM16-304]